MYYEKFQEKKGNFIDFWLNFQKEIVGHLIFGPNFFDTNV